MSILVMAIGLAAEHVSGKNIGSGKWLWTCALALAFDTSMLIVLLSS